MQVEWLSLALGFLVLIFFFFYYLINSIKIDFDIKKGAGRLMVFYLAGITLFSFLTESPSPVSLNSSIGIISHFAPSLFSLYVRLIGLVLLVVNILAVNYFFYYFLYMIKNNIAVKRYAAILGAFFFIGLITSPIFSNYFEAYTLPKLKELEVGKKEQKVEAPKA